MTEKNVFRRTIKIGTRASELAFEQTDLVIAALKRKYPLISAEPVVISTEGDRESKKPLSEFGGKGAFVTDMERALKRGVIDMAVHSSKDMPSRLAEDFIIAGVLPREDARDVMVWHKNDTLEECLERDYFVIGTSSLRRKFQVKEIYDNALFVDVRGNVPTRIRKMQRGEPSVLVLAAAGIKRLGLDKEINLGFRYFSYDEVVPAGGQGIIAIETRKDGDIAEMVKSISHERTYRELKTERYILNILDAGCHEAIGVICIIDDKDDIRIKFIKECDGKIIKYDKTTAYTDRYRLIAEIVKMVRGGRK